MPRKLYIQTRLYNINDRMASSRLQRKIDMWIDQGLLADMVHCFLPYRDSDSKVAKQLEADATTDVGESIFQLDRATLSSCCGVVGFFDGAQYDSGCAFEIGCGWAWGYPINLITTDFYKWSVGDSKEYYFASKLLEYLAKIVAVPGQDSRIEDYSVRCEEQLERAFAGLKENLVEDFGTVKPARAKLEALPVAYDYYLDPNFKYSEPSRMVLGRIISMIESAGKTYVIGDNQGDIAEDIDRLRQSKQAILYEEVFEPNVDSALIQGIAYGIGRPAIVYSSNAQRFDTGENRGSRNVMIEHSVAALVRSLKELEAVITEA